jgi:EmrB/QacA subfamily drug resistance transporter
MDYEIDYSRKWLVMATIGMGIFLATIDSSIVNVALPTLVREFNTQFAVVQWVVLGYLLTLATLMLGIGRLADMVGKKPIYLIGMILFTFSSLCCGLSPTIYWLISFRVLQGIGAVMMIALGAGILTEAFPPQERGKAMGFVGGIVSIGIITGPTLGGILIDFISWHWIFFVNIPVGITGSFMVLHFLPNVKRQIGQRFDFWGAFFLFVSLTSFLLTLTLGQKLGFLNPKILFIFMGWIIFFPLFLLIEFRVDQPMVDMKLFRNENFSLNLLTGFTTFVVTGGIVLLMPFYLENVLGLNPHQVGLLLAVVPLTAGISSPVAGTLSDRFGTRIISTIGLTLIFMGFLSLLGLNIHTSSFGYIIRFIPIGLGIGIFQSPNNSAIMGSAPKEKLGIVSSILSLTRTLGQSSGIAALGALWVSRVGSYSHSSFQVGGNRTPLEAQVRGLHDTIWAVVLLVGGALVLSFNAWIRQRKRNAD